MLLPKVKGVFENEEMISKKTNFVNNLLGCKIIIKVFRFYPLCFRISLSDKFGLLPFFKESNINKI